MVKRKSTKKTTRRRTAYRSAPRRRNVNKNGYNNIPSMVATAGLLYANAKPLKYLYNRITWIHKPSDALSLVQSSGIISKDQLVKDAVAVAGGMVGGEAIKKYAPTIIKKPLGKLAKKFKGVF